MALTRPKMPERPPVAAKPRVKPPLLPPKPTALLFMLSPSPTAKALSHDNNVCKFQTSLSKAGNIHSYNPQYSVEVECGSPEVESSTLDKSFVKPRKPPPLPALPPPIQRKGPLSVARSSTLPASFRHKHDRTVKLQTSSTMNSFTPLASASLSPSPSSNHSLPLDLPPRPAGTHKPGHHKVSHQFHTLSVKHHNKPDLLHNVIVHPAGKDTTQDTHEVFTHPKFTSRRTHLSPPVTMKPSSALQKPASILPEPYPVPETFPSAFLKSSTPVLKADTLSKSPGACLKHIVDVAEAKADVRPRSVKKSCVPPPIPKNPPRTGTLGRSKSPNKNSSQATETSRVEGESEQESPCGGLSCKKTTDNKGKAGDGDLAFSTRVDSQQSTRDKVQKLLQKHQNIISGQDRNSTPVVSVDNRCKPHVLKRSVTDSHAVIIKTNVPPKPRLRSHSTLQLPVGSDSSCKKSSKVVRIDRSDQNKKGLVSLAQKAKLNASVKQETKVECTDLYGDNINVNKGDISGDVMSHSTGGTHKYGPENHRRSQTKAGGSIHRDEESRDLVNVAVLQDTDEHGLPEDYSSLFGEKPEDTSDMLREIEELLKNKLGSLEFRIENTDTDTAKPVHRSNSEQSRMLNGGVVPLVEDVHCPKLGESSSSRSPDPGHHNSECANLRSLESVRNTTDSTPDLLGDRRFCRTTKSASSPHTKVTPPKPKRTFLHCANNIHPADPSTPRHAYTERQPSHSYLNSVDRSEVVDSVPPPLPPRNKTGSAVVNGTAPVSSGSKRDLSSDTKVCGKSRSQSVREAGVGHLSPVFSQPDQAGAGQFSHVHKAAKPRPSREALPPPPPGPPRRAATFSPGDSKHLLAFQRVSRDSEQLPDRDTAGTKSSHMLKKKSYSLSHAETNLKHMQTLGIANNDRDALSHEKEMRSSRFNIAESCIKASHSTSLMTRQVGLDKRKKSEKTPRNALLQKVAQGLGLKKSAKKSKISGVSLAAKHSSTLSSRLKDDNFVDDNVSTRPELDRLPAACRGGDGEHDDSTNSATVSYGDDLNKQTKVCPHGAAFYSSSLTDHSLSEASQQSPGSQRFKPDSIEDTTSSGTDIEAEPDMEEKYAQRKAKKAFFVTKEIVSSESRFVDVLRLLNVDFREHILTSAEKWNHPIVAADTLNKILDFLPQLQNLNEDLLKDLNGRVNHWNVTPKIADVFVKKGPFLKLYTSYIRNFEHTSAVLEDACRKNPAFAASVKEFEMSPRCARLALKHYMLTPIQRIPQYKLLLQDYLKHLTEASPDYKDTISALGVVSEVADHANNSMRHGDNLHKLLEVQRSLVGQFEVIQPGRVLIKQGELQKLSRKEMQPRMFFLFNDVLLYTTPTSAGYRVNNSLPLSDMKINSFKLEDYKFEFSIISVQRSFTLCASSFEEKDQWVSAIESAIEEIAKKHYTFQAVRQGLQTSLQDKDFILGDKAPLWVPDTRVTMCMLCLLEFTLTLRRHHCRSCGRVVCSHCSGNKAPLRYLNYEPARVCDHCFDKLRAEVASKLEQKRRRSNKLELPQLEDVSSNSLSDKAAVQPPGTVIQEVGDFIMGKPESSLNLHSILDRFQKLRNNNRERQRPNSFIPSVLKEVHANDERSDICGYLHKHKSRRWKRLWFVVKGKVLYTYKASEDVAAVESMPLLGYEVSRFSMMFEGVLPDLLFELSHQNSQPLTTRRDTSKRTADLTSDKQKRTQRLIFHTDSAASTENMWGNSVLCGRYSKDGLSDLCNRLCPYLRIPPPALVDTAKSPLTC